MITTSSSLWPRPLRSVREGHRARPALLYVQGEPSGDRPALAIIGTRQIDDLMVARIASVVTQLARLRPSASVVSGLALGCDAEGHRAALRASLHTMAVMPVGLDKIVPGSHAPLARQIVAAGGALVTTCPEGTPVTGRAYVARDWVQAAAADALLLVATGTEGGSWHATREAAALGRPLAWIEAPEEGGEAWEGNRALSVAWHQAREGFTGPLGSLLRSSDPALHTRCRPLRGQQTTAGWIERTLP